MSIFYPVIGALEEPVSLRPSGTAVVDLLSFAATETVSIIGLIIANEDASPQKVSVWWTAGSSDRLIYTGSVPANSTVSDILPAPIRLRGKDGARKIRVQAAVADKVTFTAFVASINEQAGGN